MYDKNCKLMYNKNCKFMYDKNCKFVYNKNCKMWHWHWWQCSNQNLDLDNATIKGHLNRKHSRLFLETCFTLANENSINRHIDIPEVCN